MPKSILRIVCAWCGESMGEKDGKGVSGISHSICEKCSKKIQGECNNEQLTKS